MKQSLSEKLREVLTNTTQEQFDQEWQKVQLMGFQGPLADDFIKKAIIFTAPQESILKPQYASNLNETFSDSLSGHSSYAIAA